jgi:vibriolysin
VRNHFIKGLCLAMAGFAIAGCEGSEPQPVEEPVVEPVVEVDTRGDEQVRKALEALGEVKVLGEDEGGPFFIQGELGQVSRGVSGQRLRDEARASLTKIAPVFRAREEELVFKRARVDEQGHQHVRYAQRRDGLEVVGAELVAHIDAEGRLYAANGVLGGGPAASQPEVAAEAALTTAVMGRGRAEEAPTLVYLLEGRKPKLAWRVRVVGGSEEEPVDDHVFVSALTGELLAVHPQVHHALNRAVYTANNTTALLGTLVRSEGQAPVSDALVNGHYDLLGVAHSCYKTNFNRDSYNSAGGLIKSTVHWGSGSNGAWATSGYAMRFGDGDGVTYTAPSLDQDIVVHEFAHLVTYAESNLVYQNEAGALNEALSDIFAAYCTSWKSGSWSTVTNTWLIGEATMTPNVAGDARRYMANPKQDRVSTDYYPSRYTGTDDAGGVHWNSGIPNLAFKLLATGGTHPRGVTTTVVPSIGVQAAGAIFYKANVDFFISSTTFAQAKTYTEQAAAALYGAGSTNARAVTLAWRAVGVPNGELRSGVQSDAFSNVQGSWTCFEAILPTGRSQVTFAQVNSVSTATPNADLYVKYNAPPTLTAFDCRPALAGNQESCVFSSPAGGTWYVCSYGNTAYTRVALKATF